MKPPHPGSICIAFAIQALLFEADCLYLSKHAAPSEGHLLERIGIIRYNTGMNP